MGWFVSVRHTNNKIPTRHAINKKPVILER